MPGARHDIGAAPEHRIINALATTNIRFIADNAYRGAGRTSTSYNAVDR